MNPDWQFYLLDSLGKRIRFIKQVIHELGIAQRCSSTKPC